MLLLIIKLGYKTEPLVILADLPSLACGDVGVGGVVEGDGGEDGEGRDAVAWRDGEDHEDSEGGACDLENKRYMLRE